MKENSSINYVVKHNFHQKKFTFLNPNLWGWIFSKMRSYLFGLSESRLSFLLS